MTVPPSSSETVRVYAEFNPKSEHFADVRGALLSIVDTSRAEPACLHYDVYEIAEPPRMALIGAWTDRAAYALHHATPRIQEIFERYEQWREHPPHVVRLETPRSND